MSFLLMENSKYERVILSRNTLDEIDEITSSFKDAQEMSKTFNCGTSFYVTLKSDNKEIKEPIYYDIYYENDRKIIAEDLYNKLLPKIKECISKYPNVDYTNTKYWLDHMNSISFRSLVKIYEKNPLTKELK